MIEIGIVIIVIFVLLINVSKIKETDTDSVITFRNGKIHLEEIDKRNINSNNLYTIKGATSYFNKGITWKN